MLLTKEREILLVLANEPWKTRTLKEIKAESKKKSESYVYGVLKSLVAQRILVEERKGNIILYRLGDTLKALVHAGIVAEHAASLAKHLPHKLIAELASKIPTAFFTLLVTGSYANNSQKHASDLDLIIICDDAVRPKRIFAEVQHFCEMSVPRIHLYVFTQHEFLTMLLDEKQNYGKEAARKRLIVAGGREYHTIIAEAVRHGFRG